MTRLEVEVKFWTPDLKGPRAHLQALGATLHQARVWERNVVYDTPAGALRRRDALLRLRQDNTVRLTFKGRPPADMDTLSEARIREELEVTLSDAAMMETILQRLGFEPQQVYEKYRETFRLGEVEVALDELPYGSFVELEGPAATLPELAAQLGFAWNRRILKNYLALLADLQLVYDLPFRDLTFANFEGRDVTFGPAGPPFEQGADGELWTP